jgi:predicted metal-dependent HD superfamily phosphohydrolase
MFKWSRITDTPLARAAIQKILDNFCEFQLSYHNLNHIERMYEYLHETNEPYDECLDWAVLFHDIVYDEKPEKEYRSAIMFSDMKEMYSGCDLNALDEGHVVALIMATHDHRVIYPTSSPIIRADLDALRYPEEARKNFENILRESISLYKCDKVKAAEGSLNFMKSFINNIEKNKKSDRSNIEFWNDVIVGINYTIQWAQDIIDEEIARQIEHEKLMQDVIALTQKIKDAMKEV